MFGERRPKSGPSQGRVGGLLAARIHAVLPRGGTLPDDVWRLRHRGVLALLWLHLPLLFAFALVRGNPWYHALLEVAAVAVPAGAAWLSRARRRDSTIFASLGLMTASAVLVHLSGGVIEAHFHFFVMVGVVVLYQDWRPFIIAITFVVVHHGVVGVLSPEDVYNHQGAWEHPWAWAGVHGFFIVGMSIAGIANWTLNERSQSQLSRLAGIVESSHDAIYGWTLDGTITSWNEGAVRLYGYHHDEILGRAAAVLVAPPQAAEAWAPLERVAHGDRMESFETVRLTKDGRLVEVSVTNFAVRDAQGALVGGATIARDITERRRAHEALRLSEERTRGIIDSARDGFVGMDATGRISDWNRSAEGAFGWSRDEVIGRSLTDTIVPARHRESGGDDVERMLGGDGRTIDGRVELSGLHRDGHEFPIEVTLWQVGDGADRHLSAFIQDITERKRAERDLQHTLSLLGATLESTADGILVVDPEGRISSFNQRFAEMWRLPEPVLASGSDRDALAFVLDQLDDPDDFLAKVEELYLRPDADSHDTLHFKDGRVFERASKPQRVGGAIVGRVWSFHDVTERTCLEAELAEARDKALETSRLKSEFLATMSHEIRTPMNGVIGLTGLLLDTGLTETQRQYAEGVRASGEALLGIINDILDFSKIEAGKLELETMDFELDQALDEVAALVVEPARARGLELVAYCLPDVPKAVRGDVGRLRQILLNLVSNAVKFTSDGEVVVRVSMRPPVRPHEVLLHLEVTDTGIGIAPETAERLFEPFSQADASTTRRYGGTGLGLAICRRLAEAMGGTIGVDSQLGRGSTFWVDLPFATAAPPARSVDLPDRPLDGLRVLVVEDNQTNRLVLASQLLAWNLAADLAPDAFVALDHLRHAAGDGNPYDVALVDMAMPGMDGLQLARIITADPALCSTRLLLLSSMPVEAEAAAEAGFAVRLTKPARLSQLYDALLRTVAPPPQEAPAAPPEHAAPAARSRGRLLIVEDNAINQAVAKGLAANLGYGADVAGNGIEALAALERRSYDGVLMDCQMPEMDGYEATAAIRRREAGGPPVPIIAMTASALAEDRDRCLAAGMDDYVAKPVKRVELERVLDRWLPASSTSGPDRPSALDQARIDELREADPDGSAGLLAMLFASFLAQARHDTSALATAAEVRDRVTVERVAHGLKGAAQNLGALEVARLCEELEDLSATGRLADAADVVRRMSGALDRVQGSAATAG